MRDLEPIIKYKMDALESKAYKIALIWEEECSKELKGEKFVKIARGSDPRKSLLFKYCFKMARELNGILKDNELPLYIRSQIQVLKSINDGQVHALIEPQCLVGDKAWRRWKMWKFKYDKKIRSPLTSGNLEISISEGKAKAEIDATLDFISRMGCYEFPTLLSNKDHVVRWVKNGDLSGFYVLLSPWIQEIFGPSADFDYDQLYYRASATPKVEQFFREKFAHEFERSDIACLKA